MPLRYNGLEGQFNLVQSGGGGDGDVVGPGPTVTDNSVATFDGTGGLTIQESVVIIDDAGVVTGINQLNVDNLRLDGNTLSSTNTNGSLTLSPNGTGSVSSTAPIVLSNSKAIQTTTAAGETALLQAYDVDGASYTTFATLTANNTPTMDLSDSVTKGGGYIYRAGGTDIPVTDGGTGISSVSQGDILYASSTNTISALAKNTSATRYLSNEGTNNNPSWGQVDLSNGVTGNLPVTNLNSGNSASSSTFWRGDGTWSVPSGAGDVVGPASATDDNFPAFDGTTGKLIKDSGVSISSFIQSISGTTNEIDASTVTGATTLSIPADFRPPGNVQLPVTNAALTEGVYRWADGLAIHNYGTDNIFFGVSSGNGTLTGTDNLAIGANTLQDLTTGTSNFAFGANTLKNVTTGNNNVGIGIATLTDITTQANNTAIGINALQFCTGGANVAIGHQSIYQMLGGQNNVAIGAQTGTSYTGTESNNILLGYSVTGTLGESNVTRIGSGQSACYISGIDNVDVGSVASVVSISGDRLGFATITAGSGITVTPGSKTITVASSVTSGAMTLVSTQTASSSSEITFTGMTGRTYQLIWQDVRPATDTALLQVQISTNNGSSWVSSGYAAGCTGWSYNSATAGNSPSTSGFVLTGAMSNAGGNNYTVGNAVLTEFNIAVQCQITGTTSYANTGPVQAFGVLGGHAGDTGANAIRIYFSSGNIATGVFSLYEIDN